MLNKRGFQIILALAVVGVISSLLWFASKPASAMTFEINQLTVANPGSNTNFSVVLHVRSNEVLPVGSIVQLDIYNPNYSNYTDTFYLSPDPAVIASTPTVSSHIGSGNTINVTANPAPTNWGTTTGSDNVLRYGYGSPDGINPTPTQAFSFGYSSVSPGWGYASSPYAGEATLTYNINWMVPAYWPTGTYNTRVTILNTPSNIVYIGTNTIAINSPSSSGGSGNSSAPYIGGFYPTSGGPGTAVTITGANFNSVWAVSFGSTPAQSYSINSAYQITAITGAGSTGYVTLYSSNGTIFSTTYFTFTSTTTQPIINSFYPTSAAAGASVTITGSSLSGVTAVSFGGVAAQSFSINSDTQITAVVGSGATGSVSVTNNYGTSSLAGFTFGGTSAAIDATGTFTQTATVPSPDNKAVVTIPSGVKGTVNGAALTQVTVTPATSTPPLPTGIQAVGLTYDFEPSGAVFSSPVTISLIYDPTLLPQGVSESSLYLAWFDVANNIWVNLPSTVDTVNKKITAQVNHFTNFAALAGTSPAKFGVSTLQITPAQVQVGKDISVSVILVNDGSVSGDHNVILQINGNPVANKTVTVGGKSQQTVSFTVNQNTPGLYDVIIDYLSGSFTVTAAPAATATTAAPAPSTAPTSTPAQPTVTTVQPTIPQAGAKTPTGTPTTPSKSSSTNWPLIIGAIVVFILVVFVVYRVIIIQRRP